MERTTSGGRVSTRPPLRTYSKRTNSNGSTEPPQKRIRVDNGDREIMRSAKPCSPPQLPATAPPKAEKPLKKGSIMNYFKVTSPSSVTASLCEQSSDAAAPPSSTPPSSPPVAEINRKKPRRLTTRPVRPAQEDKSEGEADTESSKSDKTAVESGSRTVALRESTISALNLQTSSQDRRSDAGKRSGSKKQKTKPKQATVQTTLSLSMADKGFTECKECNMLYNPYHEKDVKYHAKRHAALVKGKLKGED